MVGDKEGRQKAMDEQEDQASFAQSDTILGKEEADLELLENSKWEGTSRAFHFAERKQA